MIRFAPLLFIFSVFLGCDTSEPEIIRVLVPRTVQNSDYTTTESGLRYFDFQVGDGDEAGDSSTVRLHHAAWVYGGDLIVSTYDSGEPIRIDLTDEGLIAGFAEGVRGMRVGGERQIVVPPNLAYGPQGRPQAGIPGNATLVYEIELTAVESD